jgi:hypothetical protein
MQVTGPKVVRRHIDMIESVNDVPDRTARLMQRVRAAEGVDGRLAAPDVATWDIFPFEGELRVKRVDDPVVPEPARSGESGVNCGSCAAGTDRAIWADDRWKIVAPEPMAFPVLLLCPIAHHDLADLPASYAVELGPLLMRVELALHSLGGVGRVHMYRVGDGAEHLHLWFFARPEGLLQVRGSSLSDWSDTLPPMPEQEWRAELRSVAQAMAIGGGQVSQSP